MDILEKNLTLMWLKSLLLLLVVLEYADSLNNGLARSVYTQTNQTSEISDRNVFSELHQWVGIHGENSHALSIAIRTRMLV